MGKKIKMKNPLKVVWGLAIIGLVGELTVCILSKIGVLTSDAIFYGFIAFILFLIAASTIVFKHRVKIDNDEK